MKLNNFETNYKSYASVVQGSNTNIQSSYHSNQTSAITNNTVQNEQILSNNTNPDKIIILMMVMNQQIILIQGLINVLSSN